MSDIEFTATIRMPSAYTADPAYTATNLQRLSLRQLREAYGSEVEVTVDAPLKRMIPFAHWVTVGGEPEWLFLVRQPDTGWEVLFATCWEECITEAEEIAEGEGFEHRVVCLLKAMDDVD